MAEVGEAGAEGEFDLVNGRLDSIAGEDGGEADVEVKKKGSGAEVHGHGVADALDAGNGEGELADGAEGGEVGSLADEEGFAFDDEQDGDGHEGEADEQGGDAVGAGPAEELAGQGAEQGDDQASEGGGVLEDDGEDGGVFAGVDGAPGGGAVLGVAKLAEADEEGVALKEEGEGEGEVAPEGRLDGARVAEVLDAFEEGGAAADEEDEEGDEERPKVELLAVAEGVGLVGGATALALAEEEEAAVAGVDKGVDGFRQHGGGAGEGKGG